MLSTHYRLWVDNQSGSAVTPTAEILPWKFDSNADKEALATKAPTFSSIGNGSGGASSTVDASTTKEVGAWVIVTFPTTGGATGDAYVYLQQSTDGGTTWANVYSNPIGTVSNFTSQKRVEAEI